MCNSRGEWDLETCPLLFIEDDITELFRYADLYEKGLPPIMAGTLDQSKSFVDACMLIWDEEASYKAEREAVMWGM